MTQYTQLIVHDSYGGRSIFQIITETKVAKIAKERDALIKGVADYETLIRENATVQADLARFNDDRTAAASAAGAADEPFDKKAWKKRRAELEERADDLTLDIQQASPRIARLRDRYEAAVAANADALIAEAQADAEAALRSLSTAAGMIERAAPAFGNSTAIIAALHRVAEGAGFTPTPVKAIYRSTDQYAEGTLPEIWAGEAVDKLTVAIGFAERVLNEIDGVDETDEVVPTDLDNLDPDLFDV